jgi:hypothetical protein
MTNLIRRKPNTRGIGRSARLPDFRPVLLSAGCQPRWAEVDLGGPNRPEAGSRFPSEVCGFPRKSA